MPTAAAARSTQPARPAKPGISTAPVARKLALKPGHKIALIGAPAGFRERLEPLPDGATVRERAGPGGPGMPSVDVVIAFVRGVAELTTLSPGAIKAVEPDGLLWVCYLKGGAKAGTDLNRDTLHAKVKAMGWEGVSLVAVDDTWSAMRFKRLT